MTRETKIGLLVGLGFIVVFAVLLSHNGTGPSPTQSLPPIVSNSADPTPSGGSSLSTSIGNPASRMALADEPGASEPLLVDPIHGGQASLDTGSDLPSPRFFDNSDMMVSVPPSAANETPGPGGEPGGIGEGMAMAAPRDILALEGATGMRMAPPVVEPPSPEPAEESVRTATPSVSPSPDGGVSPQPALAAAGGPADQTDAQAPAGPAREYVVKKGDALVTIARNTYGKSSPDVITFLVESNKGAIKDRNSLRAGQTILLPPLPPSLFETRTVSGSAVDLKKVDGLINGPLRRAPEGKPDSGAGRQAGAGTPPVGRPSLPVGGPVEFIPIGAQRSVGGQSADAKGDNPAGKSDRQEAKPKRSSAPRHRIYEVQPKDTFSSIAQRELGSRNRWVEIKQLNKDVDPLKMRPGMKIRLPSKDPMSADDSTKQASA